MPSPQGSPPRAPSWSSRGAGDLPLIVAHRGASAVEPENSLPAFRRAVTDGADGVELDVLLCASGEVVVFHDDDLVRLGGRPQRIADLAWSELSTLRLLSGATIPTLEQALDACGSLLVNVELKASGVGARGLRELADRVAAIVEAMGDTAGARILVSSFSPRAVWIWRQRAPGIKAALLCEQRSPLPWRRAWALPWLRPFAVHPESTLCTPGAVARWRRRGYRVNSWTVDDGAELKRLAALGVDGIITNHPARSRRLLVE